MYCSKCGHNNDSNSRFCQACGNMLSAEQPAQQYQEPQQQEPVQYQEPQYQEPVQFQQTQFQEPQYQEPTQFQQPQYQEPVQYQQPQYPQPQTPAPKKSPVGIIIGCVIGGVVILGVIIAILINSGLLSFFQSDKLKVTTAFASLASDVQGESEYYMEELPVLSVFKDILENQYTIEASVENSGISVDATIESDYANNQYKLSGSFLGIDAYAYLSEDYLSVECDDLISDTYGVDLNTWKDDYDDSYLSEIYEVAEFLDAIAETDDSDKEAAQEFIDANIELAGSFVTDLFKALDVKKTGKEDIKIDGEKYSATEYQLTLETEDLETLLEEYLELYLDLYEEYEDLFEEATGEDFDYMKEDLEYEIESFIDDYDDLDENEFLVYIVKNKIAMVTWAADGGMISLSLGQEGRTFDYIELVYESDYGYEEEYIFETTFEDGVFEFEFNGNTYIEYDTTDDSNNFTISDGYYDYYTFTVDSTETDVLNIECEIDGVDITMELTKSDFSKDWFDIDEDFVNIFTLDEDDFMDIAEEIMYSDAFSNMYNFY